MKRLNRAIVIGRDVVIASILVVIAVAYLVKSGRISPATGTTFIIISPIPPIP